MAPSLGVLCGAYGLAATWVGVWLSVAATGCFVPVAAAYENRGPTE